MIVICPNCNHSVVLDVKIEAKGPGGWKAAPGATLDSRALRAVHDFMADTGPGRYTSSELASRYEEFREVKKWPSLTAKGLGRAIRMNGGTAWRNATDRGWQIPELEAIRIARPAPSVAERIEREQYQQALIDHSVDIKVFSDMTRMPLAEYEHRTAAGETITRGTHDKNGRPLEAEPLDGPPFEVEGL